MVNKNSAFVGRDVTPISFDTDYKPLRATIAKYSAIISTDMDLIPVKKLTLDCDEAQITRHFQD